MEEWRPVVGYEGYYEVSTFGRVRSVDRIVVKSNGVCQYRHGRIKKLTPNKDGYLIVSLNKDGKDSKRGVHRLVYESFVRELDSFEEVDHIDFNRTNNNLSNLQILTHLQNIAKTVSAGRNFTSICDTRGCNNPNWGNRKLSKVYAEDKELARMKQGRPGNQNGRCKRVVITLPDGTQHCFDYIRECARYFIDAGIDSVSLSTSALNISRAAKYNTQYRGILVRYA